MAGLGPEEVARLSFGVNLRRERELRGITLDEISRETKISLRFLEALESDQLDRLPGGVFRRGFVKTYARYIGLNEDKVLQDYALLVAGSEEEATGSEGFPSRNPSATIVPSLSLKVTLGLLLVIVLVAFSLWYLRWTSTRSQAQRSPAPTVSAPQQVAAPSPSNAQGTGIQPIASGPEVAEAAKSSSPASAQTGAPDLSRQPVTGLGVLGELAKKTEPPNSGSEGPSAPGETSREPVLKVTAVAETWMSVEAGQQTVFSGLLPSEQVKSFPLNRPLKVTLGNAGGVRFSINNKPFAALGKPGEVRILLISPENYHQFLAAAEQVGQ
jgi:cytoskeleton protein RodZ